MIHSLYDLSTGEFTGFQVGGNPAFIAMNTPAGHGAMPGVHHHGTRKVDLSTKQVVDHQPDKPPVTDHADWTWDADQGWVLTPTTLMVATLAREKRDGLLASCDWVTTRAFDHGIPVPVEWATYRQALRDVSSQSGFPHTIDWPTPPG